MKFGARDGDASEAVGHLLSPDHATRLRGIAEAREYLDYLEGATIHAAHTARPKVTWREIGKALRITDDGAKKRWHKWQSVHWRFVGDEPQ